MGLNVVRDRVIPGPAPTRVLTVFHGFTQNVKCWEPFDAELSTSFRIERIDLPGHGGSYDDDADLQESARLALASTTGDVWLGYSLGGRVALHMALAEPQRCATLILIGAHAGIIDDEERHNRLELDLRRADYLEAVGTKRFVDEWLDQELFSGLDASNDHRQSRYTNRARGLAGSLRNCSTGRQTPLWDQLGGLTMPTLFVSGADDHRFTQLGQDLVACVGEHAQLATISGAGHSCHLEQPVLTASAVLDYIATTQ